MTIDAVIFDVDGVLVDTDASYTEAVIRTVAWLVPGAVVDRDLVRLWRRTGDWNNDWDLCYGLYAWLSGSPRPSAEGAARRTLAELVDRARGTLALDYAAVQGVFEEHYNGTAVAVARYGVPARVGNDRPLARDEVVLLRPELLEQLRTMGIVKLGVVTGRVRLDWERVASRIPLPPGVAIATDEDGRKPDPTGLRRVVQALRPTGFVLVGDTLNDLRMVRAYAEAGAERGAAIIICQAEDDAVYRDAGAAATIRRLDELPAAIRELSR
ncbi:MAG TPA: HAD family hydrolase [Candidatus Limnocylindria bacterium]|nr:HAD family hydrolase [Candidatus Limnocylindria bacterium]